MDVAASEFYNEKEKKYDLNFKEEVHCNIAIAHVESMRTCIFSIADIDSFLNAQHFSKF